ncbi:MAG: SpoIIE family protein phosphatase [Oscillospiraceae bacterium]|nr:SpoIIE family protein phosphatase [Oscillospiraceae bacterium]
MNWSALGKGAGRRVLFLLLAGLLLLAPAAPAWAAGEAEEENYTPVLYDVHSGMPFSEARAVAQTPDGFLYVGCYGGLLRYDGREFYRYDDVLGVRDLLADSRGRLWVAADGLLCLDKGELRRFGMPEGLPSETVNSVTEDSRGTVWAGTNAGLAFVAGDGAIGRAEDGPLSSAAIGCVCALGGDRVYGCTKAGDVFAVENGSVALYLPASSFSEGVSCVYPDPDSPGEAYLATLGSVVYHGRLDAPLSELERISIPELSRLNVLIQAEGRLWVGADNGIAWIDAEGQTHALDHVPLNSTVHGICCDREGNFWFASTRQGLMKLAPNIFTDISGSSDMGERVVNSTWKKDGLLYAATDTGLVVLDESGHSVQTRVSELLSAARVRAIKEDREGSLWFCCFDANALVRLSEDGELRVWNKDNGLMTNYIRTVFERADGTLAVLESVALDFFRDEELVMRIDGSRGFPGSGVLSVGESDDGTLYLGTNGDGVYAVRDGRAEPFDGPCDVASGVILQLKNDPGRDILWVLSSNAVAVLKDGEIRIRKDFPQAHIYDMLFAPDGGIWLLGANGVYFVDGESVEGEGGADYTFYSVSTGLTHMTTANSRSYVSADGDACIACTDGILGLNVSRKSNDHIKLMFTVPWLEADGVRILPGEDGGFAVPGRTKKLTICCYALSYALGDPELSYCLEGFDPEPETVKRSGLRQLTYTNLPGGTYRFVMQRTGPDGGEAYAVTIAKEIMLTERRGFHAGVVAALVVLAAAVTLLLLRRQSVKAAREREKDRIAKELDTAAGIQLSMLPGSFPAFPEREEFELLASMDPAKEVGGDFYDFFLVDRDHLVLVTADVSGKGVPAALFMMIAKTLLKNSAKPGFSPAAVLEEVNGQICEGNENGMFVTVWLGVLELSTGRLVWADAGHEKPVLFHDGSWSFLRKHNGIALGMMDPELLELDDEPAFVDQELLLAPGDAIFQYTDGVTEATDAREQLFGEERLLEALNASGTEAPEALLPYLRGEIDAFVKDAPQFDDITMLVLLYHGQGRGTEGQDA